MESPEAKFVVRKTAKGEFKCFQCRKVYPSKDGDWYPWKDMEVHLCRICAKATENNSERLSKR